MIFKSHDVGTCVLPSTFSRPVGVLWGCGDCGRVWLVMKDLHGLKFWGIIVDPASDRMLVMTEPTDTPNGPSDPDPAVSGLLTTAQITAIHDAMTLITEIVIGYHKRLVDGGVGQETADAMTKEFHDTLMAQMKAQNAVTALQSLGNRAQRRGGR